MSAKKHEQVGKSFSVTCDGMVLSYSKRAAPTITLTATRG